MAELSESDKCGWKLCAAVLMVTAIRSGITYSFGIFIVELKNEFSRQMSEYSQYFFNINT